MLIHGWDVATALGRPWPIEPGDAGLVASSVMEVVTHFVDPTAAGFTSTFGLHLRGGPAFTLAFNDGALTARAGRPQKADCRVSAEPVAYLLSAYGRIPVLRVALTGKVVAYGRRPWLAFKLGSLLRTP